MSSEKSAFRLVAVDLFDLAAPIDNIAAHPNNRVQAAIKKGDAPPFTWIVQLQFPGVERHFGYVCYFAPTDMSIFEASVWAYSFLIYITSRLVRLLAARCIPPPLCEHVFFDLCVYPCVCAPVSSPPPSFPPCLQGDTPLSRVLKPFFFGDSDEYRDQRFKLIPKIVEGNWVVRKSVGSTPAILGTKLKQHYYKVR